MPSTRAASTPLRSTVLRLRRRVEAVIAGGGPDIVVQPNVRARDGVIEGYEALSRFPAASAASEGIETDDDLDAATLIGADSLQGYRVGRPAAVDQFV